MTPKIYDETTTAAAMSAITTALEKKPNLRAKASKQPAPKYQPDVEAQRAAKRKEVESKIASLTSQVTPIWAEWKLLARRSAKSLWSAGKVLAELRPLVTSAKSLTGTGWKEWCNANGIATSSANQAIALAGRMSEAEIEACPDITFAKRICGIVAVEKTKPKTAKHVAFKVKDKSMLDILRHVHDLLDRAATKPVKEKSKVQAAIIKAHKKLDALDALISGELQPETI